jgi:hypothetical protein
MSVPSVYTNRINPSFNALDNLEADFNDLSHFVYTLSGSVQQLILNDLSDELYDLSGRTDLLGTNLASLEIRVEGISQEVDVILPDVLGLSGRVEGLSLELDTRQNDFSGLSGDVYILESQVLNISSELLNLSGYVYNLPIVPDLTTEVIDISNRVSSLSDELYPLENQFSNLSGYVYNIPAPSTPTIQQVLTAGNDANGLGILNAGDITATSFLSSSGSLSANDTTLYLDSANGSTSGITGTGGIIEAYSTLNPSISKNLLLNSQYGGNVGIRTTNPSYPLDVSGNTRIFGNTYNEGKVAIGLTPGSTIDNDLTIQGVIQITNIGGIGLNEKYAIYSFDNKLQLNPRTSTGAYRVNGLVMDSSGRTSVGLTTPTNSFDVVGLTTGRSGTHPNTYVALFTGNIGTDSGFGVGTFNGNNRIQMGFNRIRGDGSVTNGDLLITSKGSGGGVGLWPNEVQVVTALGTGTLRFPQLTTNGTLITSAGNGTVVVSSDRRVKKNIEYPDDISGLDIINKLKPAKFNYIYEDDKERKTLGFIAQEVDEAGGIDAVDGRKHQYHFKVKANTNIEIDDSGNTIINDKVSPSSPGEVETDEVGNPVYDYDRPRYMSLNDRALIVYLVKAVQELSKEVNDLKARLPLQSS